MPAFLLGETDAWLDGRGLCTARQAPVGLGDGVKTVVVDRNTISPQVVSWRFERPHTNRVAWIKRGGGDTAQAVRQSGFVAFSDVVIVPGDLAREGDIVDETAARRGKLREVDVCHAYQIIPPRAAKPKPRVFLSLGAFEQPQRATFARIREALVASDIPFSWSSYSDAPLSHGYPSGLRISQRNALRHKSECAASVSEGGYNSVHEALHLNRPVLFVPNDGGGRERQSRRVAAAKRISPVAFDATTNGDLDEWIMAVRDFVGNGTGKGDEHDIIGDVSGGFAEMAQIIEAVVAQA